MEYEKNNNISNNICTNIYNLKYQKTERKKRKE